MSGIYEGWAIVEVFGHRRLAGWVSEAEVFGDKFLRIDIPAPDSEWLKPDKPEVMISDAKNSAGWSATQLYGAKAVYGITYTTAEVVCRMVKNHQPAPVHQWELPAPEGRHDIYDDDDEGDVEIDPATGREIPF